MPRVSQEVTQSLFSGTIQKIDRDLGLFKLSESDKENSVAMYIAYYEAGTFIAGEYTGYTRIIAIRPSEGPGPSLQYILATKVYN
jgi:hypothetical protein